MHVKKKPKAHLYKRPGSNLWWCRFWIDGQEIRRSTGKEGLREAKAAEKAIRAELAANPPAPRLPKPSPEVPAKPAPPAVTLRDMAEADVKRARDNGTTESHAAKLKGLWDVMLRSLPPEISIASLAEQAFDILEDYSGQRRAKGVKGQTIRREIAAIKRALTIAHRRGHIAAMPVHWPVVRSDPLDNQRRGKLRQPEIIKAILDDVGQDVRDELMFVALTGLRAAEVKRVTALWVEPCPPGSPIPALLRIPASEAKNRHERVVGLPAEALSIIRRRVEIAPEAAHVFSSKNHKKAVILASRRAGLTAVLTLRDLRHTYATLALQGTSDPVAVQAALGHSDLKTTQRYLSTTVERTARAGVAVNEALNGLANRHSATGTVVSQDREKELTDWNHWSGRRESNSRHSAWEADALPTELHPHHISIADIADSNVRQRGTLSGSDEGGKRKSGRHRKWWPGEAAVKRMA